MENLQTLTSGLQKLEALAGEKKRPKRITKEQVLSLLAINYGYEAYKDALDNKMSAKTMLALIEQIRQNRFNKLSESATASRVAQADKNQFQKIIKQWSKEAEK